MDNRGLPKRISRLRNAQPHAKHVRRVPASPRNFWAFAGTGELPRLRPHRFHSCFAGHSAGYSQVRVDNLARALHLTLAQRALQEARRIDVIRKLAF